MPEQSNNSRGTGNAAAAKGGKRGPASSAVPTHLSTTEMPAAPTPATDTLHGSGYLPLLPPPTGEMPTIRQRMWRRGVLADAPRPWPRGRLNEAYVVFGDLVSDVLRLAVWVIAGIIRLAVWLLRLVALGIGWALRKVTRGRLRERGAEAVGWALVVIILVSTLATLDLTHRWPFNQPASHAAVHKGPAVTYVPPAPACAIPRVVCATPTATLDGQPSISAAKIVSVLAHYQSPAATTDFAAKLYDMGITYGVNPAYALAFFAVESQCGTHGVAATTQSLGNVRYTVNSASPVSYTNYEGYRAYASWLDGAADWYWVIRTYYLDQGVRNIFDVMPIYAPSDDHNDPQQYAQTVYQFVQQWTD